MNDHTWSALNCFLLQELVDMTNEVEKKGEIYFKVNFENEIEVEKKVKRSVPPP